jgi:hypothetical protein
VDEASFVSPRRYYLAKRIVSRQVDGGFGLTRVWQHHQEQQPHTLLPDGFPAKAKLATAGYTAFEDLDGASTNELCDWASLSQSQAEAVLAAYAAQAP